MESKVDSTSTHSHSTLDKDVHEKNHKDDNHVIEDTTLCSENLHNSPNSNKEPSDRLFDHFLVVGLSPEEINLHVDSDVSSDFEPRVLFQFPPDKPILATNIAQFCLPVASKTKILKRTPSCSSLNEILFGQPYLHSSNPLYVFLLNGESFVLYGICVVKYEFIEDLPTFMSPKVSFSVFESEESKGIYTKSEKPNERSESSIINSKSLEQNAPSYSLTQNRKSLRSNYVAAPRCYCFLSRFPFFRLHFEVLLAILAQERLNRFARSKELEVYLTDNDNQLPIVNHPEEKSQYTETSQPLPSKSKLLLPSGETASLRKTMNEVSSCIEDIKNFSPYSSSSSINLETFENELVSLVDNLANKKCHPLSTSESQKNQPITELLHFYYNQKIPYSGQEYRLTLPGDFQTSTFVCPPKEDSSKLFLDWILVATFKALSTQNIMRFFASILLEKSVVVLCRESLCALSSVTLSVIPLLEPFHWQGLLVPILPSRLLDILQAPVPFISGITQLFDNMELPKNVVVVDLDLQKIYSKKKIPTLPEEKKLFNNIQQHHSQVYEKKMEFQNPFVTNADQLRLVASLLEAFHSYNSWLVGKIMRHFKESNLRLDISKNRDLLSESFVRSCAIVNRPFVKGLLRTQHFSQFISGKSNGSVGMQ